MEKLRLAGVQYTADSSPIAQAALDDARIQLNNLAQHAARIPPDSPAGAALQVQLDQVSALVPGLERRVAEGQATVSTVHRNAALCQDFKDWFAAWLEGFHELPLAC